ncbi:MAG: divergent polysaccharide deacetylase family protein [Pseudomonadota bacterium]
MGKDQATSLSPILTALKHGALSVAVFGAVSAIIGAGIHITGQAEEAGPIRTVALFETSPELSATLKDRFDAPETYTTASAEPSLGVPIPASAQTAEASEATPAESQNGVRINGRLVLPGQSYHQVEEGASASDTVDAVETAASVAPTDLDARFTDNAQPFSNPEGRPIVAVIVTGMGTNTRHTLAAMDDLPAGVTFAFTPDARANLLRRAHDTGHETLVEVPLEAEYRGRTQPHSQTLKAFEAANANGPRLASVLRRKPSIYGVISHEGSRFADDADASANLIGALYDRGLPFIAHPTIGEASFGHAAAIKGLPFAVAEVHVDSRADAPSIEAELLKLETLAVEHGAALGVGFAFPLTVDMIAEWTQRLESKGILLAPVSALTRVQPRPVQTTELAVPAELPDRSP